MSTPNRRRTACIECDLLVEIADLEPHQRASCPRCGHTITTKIADDPLTRGLAFAVAAAVLLLMANAFPFLALKAGGLEKVMTIPRSAVELYNDGYVTLAVLVLGPIVGIPALILVSLMALLIPLRRNRNARWLVPAGRLLFMLNPWSMTEVFIIGVLVSLVKIGAIAHVVIGISFWAYVGFALCFTASIASLDRHALWRRIEGCTA